MCFIPEIGIITIECCQTEDESYIEAGWMYSLVESTALFEAYRYNLSVLQTIDPAKVPFEKYIVYVKKDIKPLSLIEDERTINLKPIMRDSKNTATVVYIKYSGNSTSLNSRIFFHQKMETR